jgi:hypothetical protein
MSNQLMLNLETQQNKIGDEIGAYIAVIRPILTAILYGLKRNLVQQIGDYDQVTLEMMSRLYKAGDGDVGICFEYAVHNALREGQPEVLDRIETALKQCKVKGNEISSILFGAEKSGVVDFIESASGVLTEDSVLLAGSRGRPVKLIKHIDQLVNALRRESSRTELPYSISGLWKADLFVGKPDTEYWVGTTVKISEQTLEAARGLRIGIVPSREGQTDAIRKDEHKNLIICPLPHDGAFVEVFYRGWSVVKNILHAGGEMPGPAYLAAQPERFVAKQLAERARFPVVDIVKALYPQAQPELLKGKVGAAPIEQRRSGERKLGAAIVPVARVLRRKSRVGLKAARR